MHLRRLLVCVYAVMGLQTALALDAAQPNLVFVMADDCTYRDIGCYGGQAHTPNIDALAKQGMRLNRCHRQSSPNVA